MADDGELEMTWIPLAPQVDPSRPMSSFESKVQEALANPKNQGEIPDADAVGTVGSPECGDMLRMWLKFTEKDGKRVIDRASFQAFGCQTAIAVASMATELLHGQNRGGGEEPHRQRTQPAISARCHR